MSSNGPDFIFIGPSKTASTWIFQLLKKHPSVYVPDAKDIYYFDKNFHRGTAWYNAFFDGVPVGLVKGELSHDYFSDEQALIRIAEALPSVQVVCCLRDPFDRIVSSYSHRKRLGLERKGFLFALESTPALLNESMYGDHLKNVFASFERSRILILDYDQLKSDPLSFVSKITSFLSVPDLHPIHFPPPQNVSRKSRFVWLSWVGKKFAEVLRRIGAISLLGVLKHSDIINRVFYKNNNKSDFESLSFPDHVVELLNLQLDKASDLSGMDLSKWKR